LGRGATLFCSYFSAFRAVTEDSTRPLRIKLRGTFFLRLTGVSRVLGYLEYISQAKIAQADLNLD